ncbi:MAG: sarcosine oxidase subunit gamma, partial [Rhodospirillales bacterium]
AGDPGAAGVWLGERRFRAMLNLRGDPAGAGFLAAAEAALGTTLPLEPNRATGAGEARVLWLGPDEWLVLSPPGSEAALEAKLAQTLGPHGGYVTDVGESRATVVVSGMKARDVLAKGCPLDLNPAAFGIDACAQSLVQGVNVTIHRSDADPAAPPRFELIVVRSFADFLWRFLEDAGQEYGVAVTEA